MKRTPSERLDDLLKSERREGRLAELEAWLGYLTYLYLMVKFPITIFLIPVAFAYELWERKRRK